MRADAKIVSDLRSMLDECMRGMAAARPLASVANFLGTHPRRISEAVAELAASGYPVGSVAGIGIWRIENEAERQIAIQPEAHRLMSLSKKLSGMGWRKQAHDIWTIAMDLGAVPGSEGTPTP